MMNSLMIDLPNLKSINLGMKALHGNISDSSGSLVMKGIFISMLIFRSP